MTTCHACGSDTVEGATCVVCGAEPPGATPDATTTDAATDATTDDATAADGPSVADAPTADEPGREPSWPTPAEEARAHQAPADRRVPVGAGVGAARDGADRPAAGPGPTTSAGTAGGGSVPPPPAPGATVAPAPPTPDALPVSETSRNWAMVTHLSALVSAGLGGLIFLGPLLVWLVKKDEDRYVAHHATEALNFNLSMTLYAVLAVLLVFTLVGIPITILMAIIGFPLWFIASIVAAVRAQRGEGFRYPLTIRLVRE